MKILLNFGALIFVVGLVHSRSLNPPKNKTQFMDLNHDVLMEIMDNLDRSELFPLAESNNKLSALVAAAFKPKYSNNSVIFYPNQKRMKSSNETIFINDVNTMISFLKNFGHVILKLEIFYMENQDYGKINEYINRYCYATLKEFTVQSLVSGKILENMVRPFEMLESVTISGIMQHLDSKTLPMEKLFPALRRLSIVPFGNIDQNPITASFPNLEHLQIYHMPGENEYHPYRRFGEEYYKLMMQRNPQIRSIHLQHGTHDILKLINEVLPNLETLQISFHQKNFDASLNLELITFQNVKTFIITNGTESALRNVEFSNLVEFSTQTLPNTTCDVWTSFVENKPSLKKLTVLEPLVRSAQLKHLTAIGLDLVEVDFVLNLGINVERLINFIQNNGNLNKLHLKFQTPAPNKTFEEHFGDQWTIKMVENDIFMVKIQN